MMKPTVCCQPKMWGHVKVTRRNVLTNEIDLIIDKKNTLLYSFINKLFSNSNVFTMIGVTICHEWNTQEDYNIMCGCGIGTNATPPTHSDLFDRNRCLAYSIEGTSIDRSTYGEVPVYLTRRWVFPAGTGTGTINEVFLTTYRYGLARQVFEKPIIKTEYHELTVEWRLNLSGGVSQGELTEGQRDKTPIIWKTFINNRHVWTWANGSSTSAASTSKPVIKFIPDAPYYVILGSSNADSDLALDEPFTLKGTKLWEGYPFVASNYDYTNGNCYRDFRLGLNIDQGNGKIGEMLVVERYSRTENKGEEPICRITFTPALDKINTYQLFMDLRFGLNLT